MKLGGKKVNINAAEIIRELKLGEHNEDKKNFMKECRKIVSRQKCMKN